MVVYGQLLLWACNKQVLLTWSSLRVHGGPISVLLLPMGLLFPTSLLPGSLLVPNFFVASWIISAPIPAGHFISHPEGCVCSPKPVNHAVTLTWPEGSLLRATCPPLQMHPQNACAQQHHAAAAVVVVAAAAAAKARAKFPLPWQLSEGTLLSFV